jgi:pantetheine-phosphate adenylyltransferase
MGPAGAEKKMEALVVSEETISGGEQINKYREDHGMKALDIVVIDTVPNREGLNPNDSKLSSTSLRQKEWESLQQQNKL